LKGRFQTPAWVFQLAVEKTVTFCTIKIYAKRFLRGAQVRYTAKAEQPEAASLKGPLETILRGLGLELIELSVFRSKGRKGSPGTVQVRAVVYNGARPVGLDDCSRAHHAIAPRLELAFSGQDLYVEVSSPGIDRLIKDGAECAHYRGRGVRCYRTDISDWSAGVLEAADETGIVLKGKEGSMRLDYEIIAKAKLDGAGPLDAGCPVDTAREV
jgi:ribosome maturation factor RimP